MIRLTATAAVTAALAALAACRGPAVGPLFALPIYEKQVTVPTGPNPVFVPVANQDFTWEQVVDSVDDFFRVESERRVELVGDVITEGSIVTFPRIGATIVEPHRRDSVGRFNRWQSTLQTIRRGAVVRVIPDRGGWLVEVIVQKELEDLPRPEGATAGAATLRNDSSLDPRLSQDVSKLRFGGEWIPIGRDIALEQEMLERIRERASGNL
ncbi:MAG: hypothetical protein AAGA92_01935 [Planctomycetota bacterium]